MPAREGALTVAFMGLDGTGKSTQAQLLQGWKGAGSRRVVRIHHASTKVPGLGALKRRYHARLIAVLKRRGSHVDWDEGSDATGPGRGVRLGSLIGGYLLLGSYLKSIWYRGRYRKHTVILDRCLLDDVVKARWRFGQPAARGRWLLRTAHRPDLVILFEGDPEVCFRRKKVRNCTFREYLGKGNVLSTVIQEAVEAGWTVRSVPIQDLDPQEVHQLVVRIFARELETKPGPEGKSSPRPPVSTE